MSTIVTLPAVHLGGLEAKPSNHFGQCDAYTLATLKDTRNRMPPPSAIAPVAASHASME